MNVLEQLKALFHLVFFTGDWKKTGRNVDGQKHLISIETEKEKKKEQI